MVLIFGDNTGEYPDKTILIKYSTEKKILQKANVPELQMYTSNCVYKCKYIQAHKLITVVYIIILDLTLQN